jgi:hypothetical protein
MEVKLLTEGDLQELGKRQTGLLAGTMNNPKHTATLMKSTVGYTLRDEGRVLGCIGIMPIWPGRGTVWAVLDYDRIKPAHMLALTRIGRKYLTELSPFRRIEATVVADFAAGIKWLELLGFKKETPEPMQAYGPNGEAHYLYALVK